ncbi:hypothetical protein ABT282_07335 [Streptomyces sp. NPDC000927]|uniref:hypothetical protein n=1 Tax=Streptomyces sp. NPDC000927 TaxID=3154371 RepID=UPI00331737AA
MNRYPMARWSLSDVSVGASVWTRKVPEGEGGGYYLYAWGRGSDLITLKELVQGTTKKERRWPEGKRSMYVTLDEIPVRESVQGEEIGVARIIYADMRNRFGGISEWVTYGNDGKPVWFHDEVTGS